MQARQIHSNFSIIYDWLKGSAKINVLLIQLAYVVMNIMSLLELNVLLISGCTDVSDFFFTWTGFNV